MKLRDLAHWAWQGKSIARSRMNVLIQDRIRPTGRVLDLGCGGAPSYRPLLGPGITEYVTTDIIEANRPTVICDHEAPLPFEDAAFDTVMAFNLLEHIYHHQQLVDEAHRTLKPGGVCHMVVPFLVNVHADPHDYFRYTGTTLRRLFEHAGFERIEVHAEGGLFQSMAMMITPLLRLRLLNLAVTVGAAALDGGLRRLRGSFFEERWVLIYWVKATKAPTVSV